MYLRTTMATPLTPRNHRMANPLTHRMATPLTRRHRTTVAPLISVDLLDSGITPLGLRRRPHFSAGRRRNGTSTLRLLHTLTNRHRQHHPSLPTLLDAMLPALLAASILRSPPTTRARKRTRKLFASSTRHFLLVLFVTRAVTVIWRPCFSCSRWLCLATRRCCRNPHSTASTTSPAVRRSSSFSVVLPPMHISAPSCSPC